MKTAFTLSIALYFRIKLVSTATAKNLFTKCHNSGSRISKSNSSMVSSESHILSVLFLPHFHVSISISHQDSKNDGACKFYMQDPEKRSLSEDLLEHPSCTCITFMWHCTWEDINKCLLTPEKELMKAKVWTLTLSNLLNPCMWLWLLCGIWVRNFRNINNSKPAS